MAARPITGWIYVPRAPTAWSALDVAFDAERSSELPLDAALEAAQGRWGRTRLASLTHREDWPDEPDPREPQLAYNKLGPDADASLVRSALALLEADVADAVLLRSDAASLHCALLVERAGRSGLQLREGRGHEVDLVTHPQPAGVIGGLVVAAAAIEGGLRCGHSGQEPDRVLVNSPGAGWTVEVRE